MSSMLPVPIRRETMTCPTNRRDGQASEKNTASTSTDKTKTTRHDFKRPMKNRRSKGQKSIIAMFTQMKNVSDDSGISLQDLDRLVSKAPDIGSCFESLDLDLFDQQFLKRNLDYDLRCCEGVPPLPNLPNSVRVASISPTESTANCALGPENVVAHSGDNGKHDTFLNKIQQCSSWESVMCAIPKRGRYNNILASLSISDFPNVRWVKRTIAEFKVHKKKANNRLSATKSKVKQEKAGRNLLSCAVAVLEMLKTTDKASSPEIVRLRNSVNVASLFFKQ